MVRTLGGILSLGGTPDVTRMGWPTLRAGFPRTTFLNAMRDIRATRPSARRRQDAARPGRDRRRRRRRPQHRRAEYRARGGARRRQRSDDRCRSTTRAPSRTRSAHPGKSEPSRLGWLSIGTRLPAPSRPRTEFRSCPRRDAGTGGKSGDAIRTGDRAGPFRRRLRPRDPRRAGDALESGRPQAARRPPMAWSRSCPSTSTSTTAWKTSSQRSAAPSAS